MRYLIVLILFPFAFFAADVCFVARNPAPLEHFQAFVKVLEKNGVSSTIVGLEKALEECEKAKMVITEGGNPSFAELHRNLQDVKHYLYYENLEKYVPGGYSEAIDLILKENLDGVIFANSHLAKDFETSHKKIALGYFPFDFVVNLQQAREKTKRDGKTFVYLAGATDYFFEEIFPHFIETISESSLEGATIIFQEHPRRKLNKTINLPRNNHFIISKMSLLEALSLADFVLYYQTTVAPKCLLADIHVIQIAPRPYEDVLVKTGVAKSVSTPEGFDEARRVDFSKESILEAIGYDENWEKNLIKIVKENDV